MHDRLSDFMRASVLGGLAACSDGRSSGCPGGARRALILRVGLVLGVLASACSPARAQPRILVTGDSWGAFSQPVWDTVIATNGFVGTTHVNTSIGGMTAAGLNTPALVSSQIIAPLLAFPTIDMVHLSIGGNDFLGAYNTALTPAQLNSLYSGVQANVQSLVDQILAVRPTIQVTIASYDYLNYIEPVLAGDTGTTALWLLQGAPSAGQLNRALFGSQKAPDFNNSVFGLEDFKTNVAVGNPRVHYSDSEGLMQLISWGFSNLDLPTPLARMNSAFGYDPIHLDQVGYAFWAQQAMLTANNNLLADTSGVATNPGSGGSVSFGNVLVGQSASQTVTATNTGQVGSRLSINFVDPASEFHTAAGTQYGFVDQWIGGVPVGAQYGYSPTARGSDSQGASIVTQKGTSTLTLQGQGVAPVSGAVTNANAGPTLVGATRTMQVDVGNVGDGNLSGAGSVSNLHGSLPGASGEFARLGSGGFELGDGQSGQFTYSYTPSARGSDSQALSAAFTNGSPDGTNQAHTRGFTISGQGVAPVSSAFDESANSAGIVLVGQVGSASVGLSNLGDGNLSGLGAATNLRGQISTGGGPFTLQGSDLFSLPDASTESFHYQFAPVQRGSTTVNLAAEFENGSADGTNQVHGRVFSLSGQAVAPVNQVTVAQAGLVRFGTATTVAVVDVQNVGDGNLSGLGSASNLHGSVGSPLGSTAFSGAGGTFDLDDGASASFQFVYAPNQRGFDNAALIVSTTNGSTNGWNQPEMVGVNLLGQSVGPNFQSTPANGSQITVFDNTHPGPPSGTDVLSIANTSTDPNGGDSTLTDLTLLGYSLTGPDAAAFSLLGFQPGQVLGSGESVDYQLTADPLLGPGRHYAFLTLFTDQGAAFGQAGQSFQFLLEARMVPEAGSLTIWSLLSAAVCWQLRRRRQAAGRV